MNTIGEYRQIQENISEYKRTQAVNTSSYKGLHISYKCCIQANANEYRRTQKNTSREYRQIQANTSDYKRRIQARTSEYEKIHAHIDDYEP